MTVMTVPSEETSLARQRQGAPSSIAAVSSPLPPQPSPLPPDPEPPPSEPVIVDPLPAPEPPDRPRPFESGRATYVA